MSGDQTPKLKPSFGNRSKRLSDASIAYKNPLLHQSSPNDDDVSNSSLVNSKRPCQRNRLSIGSSSFKSPILSSPLPVQQHSRIPDLKNSPKSSKIANRRRTSNLFASPLSKKDVPSATSPMLENKDEEGDLSTDAALKEYVMNQWQELQVLNEEVSNLKEKGYKVEELKWHIDKLHEYNEVKDIAQLVMGRIAEINQTTVKTVHEQFGLTEDDD